MSRTAAFYSNAYDNARCLTLNALALMDFEPLLQLSQVRRMAYDLWARVPK
jgi:hypothetical protein